MSDLDRSTGAAFDGHPGEALSGLLDGELGAAEAGAVQAHVRACTACAEELHWLRAARWSVRNLPAVEPPAGFLELVVARLAQHDDATGARTGDGGDRAPIAALAHRRLPKAGAVAAAVAAGVALFALSVPGAEPGAYTPAVDAAVERHVASLSALSTGGLSAVDGGPAPLRPARPVTPTTAAPRDPRDLPAPFQAPARLDGGYRLVEAFAHPEGLQLVYRNGRYGLSVFEAPGRLHLADLPPEGRAVDLAGVTGWRWESDEVDGRVVVFEREGLVVTVIGDEPGDAVTQAARSVPEPRPLSLVQRLGEAGVRLFEALSP